MGMFPSSRVPVLVKALAVSVTTLAVCTFAVTGQASASEKQSDRGKHSAPGHLKKDAKAPTATTVAPKSTTSTTSAKPAPNGSGEGKATGKPCAGCVGKADDKSPKGQAADGSDKNKGYECDKNNGIGKGNPAHSSCSPSVLSTDTKATTTTSKPAATTSTVAPSAKTAAPEVLSETVTQPAPEKLALTGASSGSSVTLAIALLLFGSLLALAATIHRNYRLPGAAHLKN